MFEDENFGIVSPELFVTSLTEPLLCVTVGVYRSAEVHRCCFVVFVVALLCGSF